MAEKRQRFLNFGEICLFIITKCKDVEEALFYIEGTIREGWSRNALMNCIKADLYHKCRLF